MNFGKYYLGIACGTLLSVLAHAAPDIENAADGAFIKLFPDGSYQVMAVGTGTYDFNDPDDILDARKAATLRAKAAISKFLKEDLSTQEGLESASKKIKAISKDGKEKKSQISKISVQKTMESIRNSSSALLTGVIVLGDAKIPQGDEGGTYRVMVGVSSKSVQTVTKLKADTGAGTPIQEESPVAGTSAAGEGQALALVKKGAATDLTKQSGDLPPLPEGWILCVGVGANRKEAVQQALIEGVSQIYGENLQNSERLTERMSKFKANIKSGALKDNATLKISKKKSESNTFTQTAGFVRQYRIIEVSRKGLNQEAKVYAKIVNPRANAVALMVYPPKMVIQNRTKMYKVGPKCSMSGAEIGQAIAFALPTGLAQTQKFLILNDSSLKTVIQNNQVTGEMVQAGLANASELMQLGQGLTPDYSLRTELKDVKYSKKLGLDKSTNKFTTLYKMAVKLSATLTNERTGAVEKTTALTLTLDNDEISGLLEEDEDADLLQAVLSKLAGPIEQWIKSGK